MGEREGNGKVEGRGEEGRKKGEGEEEEEERVEMLVVASSGSPCGVRGVVSCWYIHILHHLACLTLLCDYAVPTVNNFPWMIIQKL